MLDEASRGSRHVAGLSLYCSRDITDNKVWFSEYNEIAMSVFTDIVSTLRSPFCNRINFQVGPIQIQGTDYAGIAHYVEYQTIQVVQSSTVPSTMAAWDPTYNCFEVGQSPSQALIVHEATHAINDLRQLNVSTLLDEAGAYIAQMVFRLATHPTQRALIRIHGAAATQTAFSQCINPPPNTDYQAWETNCGTAVVGYAASIAENILSNRPIETAQLESLIAAIRADPRYFRAPPTRAYTGIAHVTIPASHLRPIRGHIVNN